MIRSLGMAAFVVIIGATPNVAQSASSPPMAEPQQLSHEDQEFLSYAAEDNQAEIALCLLAEKRAKTAAIKAFARLMIDDHAEIESRLAAVADAEQVGLPEGVGADGRKTHDRLDPLSGREFEAQFLTAQIKDHEDDVKRFGHQASTTKNAALRQFASETGPLLEQHLALAKAVQNSSDAK